jgi:hypothetical protein
LISVAVIAAYFIGVFTGGFYFRRKYDKGFKAAAAYAKAANAARIAREIEVEEMRSMGYTDTHAHERRQSNNAAIAGAHYPRPGEVSTHSGPFQRYWK